MAAIEWVLGGYAIICWLGMGFALWQIRKVEGEKESALHGWHYWYDKHLKTEGENIRLRKENARLREQSGSP